MMLRPVLVIAVAALLLGGCSDDDDEPSAAPATIDSASPTDTPAKEPAPEAGCQVDGFVPSTQVVFTGRGPTVLVASLAFEVAGRGIVTPGQPSVGGFRPAVTVTSGNGPLDAGAEGVVLRSMGGPGEPTDSDAMSLAIPADRATEKGAYVAYQTAGVAHGRFRVKACGAPYNDGESVEVVSGTYRALEKVSPTRVVRCDADPADAGQKAAQRAGCGG